MPKREYGESKFYRRPEYRSPSSLPRGTKVSPINRAIEFTNTFVTPLKPYTRAILITSSPADVPEVFLTKGEVAVCLHEATKIMSNKIGRFEILSEIAHSDLTSVYKATDPESGQTVALKTIKLEPLGEQSATVVKNLIEEGEASKVLNSHNIAVLHGGEEVDGVFCASLEYVQGKSVATMLARKEGFSI